MYRETEEFILENLDLIDTENWYKLFSRGYQMYTKHFWEDLFLTIDKAGIEISNMTKAMKMNILDTVAKEIDYCVAEDLIPMSLRTMVNRPDIDHYACDSSTVVEDFTRAYIKGYFNNQYWELHNGVIERK